MQSHSSATPISRVASLRIDSDRLARMWAMTPEERVRAARQGRLSLGEMLRWAARRPSEVELVDGEFWFITALTPEAAEAPEPGALSDSLCVCGHRASDHATPDSGDTRCLAVEAREDLLSVFEDGRDGAYGYCACLRFTHAQPSRES